MRVRDEGDWPVLQPRRLDVATEDGVRLDVREHGAPSAEAAGTVVLVHGYQLTQELWARQVAALVARRPDLRVLTYDHRGHGGSGRSRPERCTLEQLGRDLLHLLDEAVPAGPLVLVGHSMGGMTVMSAVEQRPHLVPDRVVAAALVSTSAAGLAENHYRLHPRLAAIAHATVPRLQRWVHRRVEKGRRQPPSPGTRFLLFGRDADPADVRRAQRALDGTPAATSAHFYETFADHDRLHALRHLGEVPVLVACGDLDRITPIDYTHALAAEVPHAEVVVYPGAGHMLMLERAEDLTRRLLALTEAVPTALPTAGRRAG